MVSCCLQCVGACVVTAGSCSVSLMCPASCVASQFIQTIVTLACVGEMKHMSHVSNNIHIQHLLRVHLLCINITKPLHQRLVFIRK